MQQELESLAGNVFNPTSDSDSQPEPMKVTVARWQKLFDLPQAAAVDVIMSHRNNLTRTRVSDTLWDSLRPEKESQGYDREAYEYEIYLQKKKALLPELVPIAGNSQSSITYLVELCGALNSAEKIRDAAKMVSLPQVVTGESVEDGRAVELCCVDGAAKAEILRWAGREGGGFEPTILVNPRSLR